MAYYSNQFPRQIKPKIGSLWLTLSDGTKQNIAKNLPFSFLQRIKKDYNCRGYRNVAITY